MIFKCISPLDGRIIYFSNFESAKLGSLEIGTYFFYPRKSMFSTERQKFIYVHETGQWIKKRMSQMKCTCGCNGFFH